MIKDVGGRIALCGHWLSTHRHPYPVVRHQNVRVYRSMMPWVQDAGFVAPNALVMGNVALGHDTVIFYHTVIRNFHTKDATRIGDHTAIMDRVSFMGQVQVGSGVYVGPGATLDCCTIHSNVYIGAGACIGLGAIVEDGAIVAAGSVVPKDVRIPAGELWAGSPAEKISDVTSEQAAEVKHLVHHQVHVAKAHGHAIHDHVHETEELSREWLDKTIALMEAQQQAVKVHTSVEIPVEAKRFLQPRVYQRRPEMHMRMSYPVNRMAPWMPKFADQCANA
jgi:carbonic anhydrase/acetyltransferase-like protein (isoleucine patch superfamily)